MRRCQVIHQRAFGLNQIGGVGNFALMIGTELDDRILMFCGQPQQRHRHAIIVVEIACGVERFTALTQNRRRHLFNRGFAGGAGQRHYTGGRLLTHPCAQPAKGETGIFNHHLWHSDR